MGFDRFRPLFPTTGADPSRRGNGLDAAEDGLGGIDRDARWINEALALARAMQGWVWPNPAVGCVIVRDGHIVGRGQTQFGGRPHAERMALDDAGDRARGATLYVTLEPCCHWGKTPPCADAIIGAGVTAVFASLQDPDPRVDGGGFRKLREAGIVVHVGLGAAEAQRIMAGFFHRVATGLPLVTIVEAGDDMLFIPEGFDAVLRSAPDRLWLLTRAPGDAVRASQITHPGCSRGALLGQLGQMGLTTICVAAADRLAVELESAGAVAPTQFLSSRLRR